ncbi:MAG: hypothetical protein QOK40_2117 [Miltoncostaeaceae bacterium]|jgi:hypothetical protein|nr:hypothetical protein [Miltoncostaeaceae bacterium]
MSHASLDESLEILVLGPSGPARRQLEHTLHRLGHETVAAHPAPWTDLTPGEVVVLDARGPGTAWRAVAGELISDPRPLLVITDDPRELSTLFRRRWATALAMTGADHDAGYAMALRLCAGALARVGEPFLAGRAGRSRRLATAAA